MFTRGNCIVKREYTKEDRWTASVKFQPKGSVYFTVVNKDTDTHRHYDFFKQAKILCKRIAQKEVRSYYDIKAQRDIVYMITKDYSVYTKRMSKKDLKNNKAYTNTYGIIFKGGSDQV